MSRFYFPPPKARQMTPEEHRRHAYELNHERAVARQILFEGRPEVLTEGHLWCVRCRKERPEVEFYGFDRGRCKACRSALAKQYRPEPKGRRTPRVLGHRKRR